VEKNKLREKIKKAQEKDKKVVKAVEELKKAGIKMLRDEEWTVEEGIVMKEGQIYVPEEEHEGRTNICSRGRTKGRGDTLAL